MMEEGRETLQGIKPQYAKHQTLFSIVYPRDKLLQRGKKNELDESRLKELKTYELLK